MSAPSALSSPVVGIDIGGTFTDFVVVDSGRLTIYKRLSTPDDPSSALLAGIAHLKIAQDAGVVHGSTIATNALLERRGARTGLITTSGFRDVLSIGRQSRPDLYALHPEVPPSLVPPEWRFEVVERVSAAGEVLESLDAASLEACMQAISCADIESVAICLLFSFLYPEHEQAILTELHHRFGAALSISLSSQVLPEYREYERASTTVINAYVAPLTDRYLARVEAGLGGRRLRIMQSNGGVITAAAARQEAARTVLSGPAGGAVGAFHVASRAGYDHIISFDMGGTSTDVAIFPGDIIHTRDASIGGLPLRLPVVDVHTVGAGGGSIAQIDAGGALQVGPQSAGADPGPACYGRGDLPTTSDANLVLGRLHSEYFLGGRMKLYPERARAVLKQLAAQMGYLTPEEAAWGVIQVANAAMEQAIRSISIERGYDPRSFTLVAFGGAGPLHACALAESLHIPRILIPPAPGVLSALGMIIADLVKDYSQTVMAGENVLTGASLDKIFKLLEMRAVHDLLDEGVSPESIELIRGLDMRYAGQSHELTIQEPEDRRWADAFHAAHQKRYGHSHTDEPVEVVNVRLRAVGHTPKPAFQEIPAGGGEPVQAIIGQGPIWFEAGSPITSTYYDRARLLSGDNLKGPAVVFQMDTTTVVAPSWRGVVDRWGNLLLMP